MILKKLIVISVFCLIPVILSAQNNQASFKALKEKGGGSVTIFYYPVNPFIYQNDIGELKGIEYEILESFFRFIEKKHEIDIKRNWKEVSLFEDLFSSVESCENHAFGVSVISYTKSRDEIVDFSKAYMPDVSVLISNLSVPLMDDSLSLQQVNGFTAATMSNTTYKDDLDKLKKEYGVNLDYIDVANDKNIIQLVSKNRDMIGYVGLPFYVIQITEGYPVKRHSAFQVKRDGYRFIYQQNEGWDNVVADYFDSYLYRAEADKIIRNYLGNDYSELIWGLAANNGELDGKEEVAFLNREKEIQSQRLLNIQNEKDKQRFIIISISIGLIFVFLLVLQLINTNRMKARDNRLLQEKSREMQELLEQLNEQKNEISYQRKLLQKKNQELTETNKQKDDLIGLVAHDLKSPINQMGGLINLLGFKNEHWNKEELEIYQKLESSTQHLKELVERILDLDALGKKILNYDLKEINMRKIIDETIEDFIQKAANKNITFNLENLQDELYIKADPFFLRQVFENIISNALKFSPNDTTVSIFSEDLDAIHRVGIKDEGPGLTKDDLASLFTKYQTLSAKPTGDETSTGLGLSIVKKYVEEMNGSVWAESEESKGATFYVAFEKQLND